MIANIFDQDGNMVKTTSGNIETIELNTPDGGSYILVDEFKNPTGPPLPPEVQAFIDADRASESEQ